MVLWRFNTLIDIIQFNDFEKSYWQGKDIEKWDSGKRTKSQAKSHLPVIFIH